MKDVLELPEDDYFHVIHGKEPENMIQAPVFWGVERSAGSVFIQMSFNPRPPAQKEALFASVAERLVESPGVRREDIFMMILETAAENWWAHAREVDAETGFDARM
jgi:phenylpyruvate tautomerase PptA (4-oxalocrotonate tautomerase family)